MKQKKVDKGKYKVKRCCRNCFNETELSIPKGTTVKEYFKNRKCKFCGCNPRA